MDADATLKDLLERFRRHLVGEGKSPHTILAYTLRTLGRTGTGYIMAPCHNIQANTPMENILAMYQAPRTLDQAGTCEG